MLSVVHNSWFMLFRRLYLSYNVALAALLIAMQGLSFGIQLFYKFRLVELNPHFDRFSTMMSQISIVAKIIVMSVLCSMVLAKCVALGRMVWRAGQFQILGSKAARFFMMKQETHPHLYKMINIILQLILLVALELIPFAIGLTVVLWGGDLKLGVQVCLSTGVLVMILMVITWFIGSIVESYKRLFMFCVQRKGFFIKFERMGKERARRRKRNRNAALTDVINAVDQFRANQNYMRRNETTGNESESGSPTLTAERDENKLDAHVRDRALSATSALSATRQRSFSVLSTHSTRTDITSAINTTTADDNFSLFGDTAFSVAGDKGDHGDGQIDDMDDLSEYENNLWVLLYYFCCHAEVFRSLYTYVKEKTGGRTIYEDLQLNGRMRSFANLFLRQLFTLKMRNIWITLGLVILFFVVFSVGFFQIWRLFIVSAVVAVGTLLNLVLNRISFIPKHNPSKKRLKYIWVNGNILDKYVGLIEEIFYHSPKVVFKGSKFIFFLLSFLISVCMIFEFSETAISFTGLIILFYIVRFNAVPLYENVNSFAQGDGFSSLHHEDEEIEARLSVDVEKQPINVVETRNEHETIVAHPGKAGPSYGSTETNDNSKVDTEENDRASNSPALPPQSPSLSVGRPPLSLPPPTALPNHKIMYHISRTESRELRICSVLFLSLVLSVSLISVLLITIVFQGFLSFLVFFTMLAMMCFIIFMRYDDEIAGSMVGFFALFIALLGTIFLVGSVQMNGINYESSAVIGHYVNGTENPYPICNKEWQGFKIADYAFFSRLAYESDPYFTEDLNIWFPDLVKEGARIEHRENRTVSFYDLYVPSRNLSIIGVRGTSSPIDVIQDVDLWKEAALLQAASLVGPFVSTWPETMTQWIIWVVASLEKLTTNNEYWEDDQRYYFDLLDDYVNRIKGSRNIVLTGHSLGGGLCKIAGAKHRLMAVTFSGPGVTMSSMKLGLNTTDINRHVVSVRPASDLVPKIDRDGGLLQSIDCQESFLKCHLLTQTTKELIQSCGSDERGRWIKG